MSTLEFNEQMLHFKTPLKYFAISLTADNDDADDLLQDTMLKALMYKDKYADSTNLKAWLYTIMKNTFINNYRRGTKTRQIIDKTKDLYFLNIPSSNSSVSPVSQISEKDIKKHIDALEDELRIPFVRYFEGYKYKEIADFLDIPIGTVKSRIFLARKKLIVSLKDFR
jgi:RNA polymerase sigma factor (sigma-70 family)